MSVRRAFLWASGGRYLLMAVNLATSLVLARLLAPDQFGVTVVGGAVFTVAEALRALSGGAYLIQKAEIAAEDIRACFTLSLASTLLLGSTLVIAAGPLALFFGMPQLKKYLEVGALGYMLGPFIHPIWSLMSRNLQFGPMAFIGLLNSLTAGAVSISLALRGFGYMSFAWAGAAATAVSMLSLLFYCKDRSIFRPIFSHWREVLKFGVYDSATGVISQVADTLPYFIFGRMFPADVVGLAQRAVSLCLTPERIILSGVSAVALPAFSIKAREGDSLQPAYLRALELITAAQWPSLCILIFLAQPLVWTLFGSQWLSVAPLLQILASALFLSFPITLQYATIVASGGIRYMPLVLGVQSVISLTIFIFAARYGLYAAIWSSCIVLPANGILALSLARHFLGFRWSAVFRAISKSVVSTLLSAAGPATVWFLYREQNIPLPAAALAVLLCGAGWLAGLVVTRHPLLDEMLRIVGAVRGSSMGARLGALRTRLFSR
jgi:O-antigen/teichoic acid export membrane protein